MSRYIDADKTLAYISRLLGGLPLALLNECEKNGIDIVRCKECKFNYGNEHNCSFNPDDIVCTYWESDGLQSDDYCSYGEREGE